MTYDKYYQTANLFGAPYPELMEFFSNYPGLGKVLDLGCGQGRDAIPLARLGFEVTAIDNSRVGIEQMMQVANSENIQLNGIVADIFKFDNFSEYDFVLLDSMFHFSKNDLKKETDFIQKIIAQIKKGCLVIFCIQDTGKKVEILNKTIDSKKTLHRIADQKFVYTFKDSESGHQSTSNYRLIVVEK